MFSSTLPVSSLRNASHGLTATTLRTPRGRWLAGCAAALWLGLVAATPGAAQTTIAINNSSFESPTPTLFPAYTIGATNWTQTRNDVDAGTFAPVSATPPVTPAPIDGVQVGYANGSGGLQQVLATGFTSGYRYTFSVYIGYRSDEVNAVVGNGAIQLGYLDGAQAFVVLGTQLATPSVGQFNFVTGAYQSTLPDAGHAIAICLVSTGSVQVLFDQVQLTATAIPEPATVGWVLGGTALLVAMRLRRGDRLFRGPKTT